MQRYQLCPHYRSIGITSRIDIVYLKYGQGSKQTIEWRKAASVMGYRERESERGLTIFSSSSLCIAFTEAWTPGSLSRPKLHKRITSIQSGEDKLQIGTGGEDPQLEIWCGPTTSTKGHQAIYSIRPWQIFDAYLIEPKESICIHSQREMSSLVKMLLSADEVHYYFL